MKFAAARAVGAGLILCLSAGPTVSADRAVTVLARAGGSVAEREADELRCAAVAAGAPQADLHEGGDLADAMGRGGQAWGRPPVARFEGPTIGGLINTIPGALETQRLRDLAEEFCLSNLGYVPVTLTPEEGEAFRSAEFLERLRAGSRDG